MTDTRGPVFSGCRAALAMLLLLGLSAPSVAQQTSAQENVTRQYLDAGRGLTVDQLVALALERSPAILAARSRVDVAKGELSQAALRPNPSLSVDWREEVGGTDRQSAVGISWPLDLFRRDGRANVSRQHIIGAEQAALEQDRQVASAVRQKAGRVLAAVRQLEVRLSMADAARQTRDLLAARAASGAGPPLERDMADVESRRAEADVLRQRAETDARLAELKAVLGMPSGAPLMLRDSLEVAVLSGSARPLATDPTAIAQAIAGRADVRASETEIALATARADLLRREGRLDLSLVGSYMRMNASFPQFGFNAAGQPAPIRDVFHTLTIGAMVTLPWRDRRQGAIAAATAAELAARHERDERRFLAEAELDAARALAVGADQALAIYTGGLRDLAAKNLTVIRESHQLGRATVVDVLNELRRYLEVETAYTQVLLDTLEARLALATAMGVIR